MCLSVGVCEGGGVRPPPRERVSRAVAEGRRAECVCEAESELESVYYLTYNHTRFRNKPKIYAGHPSLPKCGLPSSISSFSQFLKDTHTSLAQA